MRNIIITLPKTISWEDYKKELANAAQGDIMNFKVPFLPKEPVIGGRCYVLHDGYIKGWMLIMGTKQKGFNCTTTGKRWDGNFIERSGEFHYLQQKIKAKGFQSWHYLNQDYN